MTENKGEIILYQPDEEVKLEVRLEEDTVWLNRQQLAELFARNVKTIGKHINNALREELVEMTAAVVAKFATTAADGKVYQVEYYNLDVILSVGYRVKSSRSIEFRRWANKVLKEYLLKGYSVNQRLIGMEQRIDRKLQEHEQRLNRIDGKIDFFVRHNDQYPSIDIRTYRGCHDRFLIVDGNDIYHIGASLKDLGKRMFAFSKLEIPASAIMDLL